MNTLILGGARSGKSRFAQELVQKHGGMVLFVATAEAGDSEMCRRIERHKNERPSDWRTLEAVTHIGKQIERNAGDAAVVLVDCITLLVNNVLCQHDAQYVETAEESLLKKEVMAEITELLACMKKVNAAFIIISNEVGLGIVPDNRLGRLYRDLLGKANQVLAQTVDEVYLMVAGLPLKVKPATPGERNTSLQ